MEITNHTRGTKMLSIAICDDQQDSLETIEEELHRSSKNLNVEIETHLYTDGNDMLGLMKNNKDYFDVVFLDIDMPKISGLDVAAKMRSINQEILLVFISAHEQYVFDSIDYSPIKYIRKLKMHDEIELALKKANKCINSRNTKTIIIKTDDGEIRLRHDDIMYFEMYRRRITVYINNGKAIELKERKTIKSLYPLFPLHFSEKLPITLSMNSFFHYRSLPPVVKLGLAINLYPQRLLSGIYPKNPFYTPTSSSSSTSGTFFLTSSRNSNC